MQKIHCAVPVILGIFLLGLLSQPLPGQVVPGSPKVATLLPLEAMQRDLAARKKTLLSESNDLEQMAQPLRGVEMDTAIFIEEKAGQGVMEVDAALWFSAIYNNMQCDADREVAKKALKNRLGFYAHLLDLEAGQVAGQLAYTRLPALAQSGEQIKGNLHAAKATLDQMSDLLN